MIPSNLMDCISKAWETAFAVGALSELFGPLAAKPPTSAQACPEVSDCCSNKCKAIIDPVMSRKSAFSQNHCWPTVVPMALEALHFPTFLPTNITLNIIHRCCILVELFIKTV